MFNSAVTRIKNIARSKRSSANALSTKNPSVGIKLGHNPAFLKPPPYRRHAIGDWIADADLGPQLRFPPIEGLSYDLFDEGLFHGDNENAGRTCPALKNRSVARVEIKIDGNDPTALDLAHLWRTPFHLERCAFVNGDCKLRGAGLGPRVRLQCAAAFGPGEKIMRQVRRIEREIERVI